MPHRLNHNGLLGMRVDSPFVVLFSLPFIASFLFQAQGRNFLIETKKSCHLLKWKNFLGGSNCWPIFFCGSESARKKRFEDAQITIRRGRWGFWKIGQGNWRGRDLDCLLQDFFVLCPIKYFSLWGRVFTRRAKSKQFLTPPTPKISKKCQDFERLKNIARVNLGVGIDVC